MPIEIDEDGNVVSTAEALKEVPTPQELYGLIEQLTANQRLIAGIVTQLGADVELLLLSAALAAAERLGPEATAAILDVDDDGEC